MISGFYHAAEYLAKLARALHPTDEEAVPSRTVARNEGGGALIAVLEEWARPNRKGLPAVRAEVLGHFSSLVHRVDYPIYEVNEWYSGLDT